MGRERLLGTSAPAFLSAPHPGPGRRGCSPHMWPRKAPSVLLSRVRWLYRRGCRNGELVYRGCWGGLYPPRSYCTAHSRSRRGWIVLVTWGQQWVWKKPRLAGPVQDSM